jgi:hypothetical protein
MTGGARGSSKLQGSVNEFPYTKAQILQRIKAKERYIPEYQLDQASMEKKIIALQKKKHKLYDKKHREGGHHRGGRIETEADEPLASGGRAASREQLSSADESELQSDEFRRKVGNPKTIFFGKRPVVNYNLDYAELKNMPHPNADSYGLRRFRRAVRKVMNSMEVQLKIDIGLSQKNMIKFIGDDRSGAKLTDNKMRQLAGLEIHEWSLVILWDTAVLLLTAGFLYELVFR